MGNFTVSYFMWGYQAHFQASANRSAQELLNNFFRVPIRFFCSSACLVRNATAACRFALSLITGRFSQTHSPKSTRWRAPSRRMTNAARCSTRTPLLRNESISVLPTKPSHVLSNNVAKMLTASKIFTSLRLNRPSLIAT